MNQLAANLVDHVLPIAPVRHWVLSFPLRTRFLLARHTDLRNEVLGIFVDEVQAWHREATAEPAGDGGSVSVWQLAGSALNLNPHIHAIFIDGTYIHDANGVLVFRPARRPPAKRLQILVERVRRRVEARLIARGFDEDCVDDEEDGLLPLQAASVEGRGVRRRGGGPTAPDDNRRNHAFSEWFDLHVGSSIDGEDRDSIERLVRYVARPPFSLGRLSQREDGTVVLAFGRQWRDGTICAEFDPLTFLGRLAAIVARPNANLTHYHGVLAAAHRFRSEVIPEPCEPTTSRHRSKWISWRDLMLRIFGIDPLLCPICGSFLTLKAIIERRETALQLLDVIALRASQPRTLPHKGPPGASPTALGP